MCASGASPATCSHIARCRWRCVVRLRCIAGDVFSHRAMLLAMPLPSPRHRVAGRGELTSRDVARCEIHIARCEAARRTGLVWLGLARPETSRDVYFASRDASLPAGDVIPHRAMSLVMCCAPPAHRRRCDSTSRDVARCGISIARCEAARCTHLVWPGLARPETSHGVYFASRDIARCRGPVRHGQA